MTMFPGTPADRAPLPVLRAGVFAVVGTVLGVTAHHLVADGPAPWRHGASAAMALFGVGLFGTRRPRSPVTMVTACGAGQVGLHLWLSAAGSAHHTAVTAVSGHAPHVMGPHQAWHDRPHDSLAMTAVHAAAALLVAVLLHRADAACWLVTRGLPEAAGSVRARIATVRALCGERPNPAGPGPARPVTVRTGRERPSPTGVVLADVVVRRGPPRAWLALAH